MKSTNGTYVNGNIIPSMTPYILNASDVLSLQQSPTTKPWDSCSWHVHFASAVEEKEAAGGGKVANEKDESDSKQKGESDSLAMYKEAYQATTGSLRALGSAGSSKAAHVTTVNLVRHPTPITEPTRCVSFLSFLFAVLLHNI